MIILHFNLLFLSARLTNVEKVAICPTKSQFLVTTGIRQGDQLGRNGQLFKSDGPLGPVRPSVLAIMLIDQKLTCILIKNIYIFLTFF